MHYVDCYSLYLGFYILYVGYYRRFMGCIATMWAAKTSMWVVKASARAASTSNSNPDRRKPGTKAGKQDMELRQGIKTGNQE